MPGHRMTALHAAIPLKVIASPVDTWNTLSHLALDDALSTTSALPMDTDTTLFLRDVHLETTPPNIIDNAMARTIATIHQHYACAVDNTFNARKPQTLLDALANLVTVEASITTMSTSMCTFLKNIGENIRNLATTTQALSVRMEE
jgi:hypothetical protein